ncbi:MAG: hypothetical protein ACPHK8_05365 [Thermoplasmatota archaeon]
MKHVLWLALLCLPMASGQLFEFEDEPGDHAPNDASADVLHGEIHDTFVRVTFADRDDAHRRIAVTVIDEAAFFDVECEFGTSLAGVSYDHCQSQYRPGGGPQGDTYPVEWSWDAAELRINVTPPFNLTATHVFVNSGNIVSPSTSVFLHSPVQDDWDGAADFDWEGTDQSFAPSYVRPPQRSDEPEAQNSPWPAAILAPALLWMARAKA